MKKLSDLPKEEKEAISREIDVLASQYSTDFWDGEVPFGRKIEMGLCSTCKDLRYTKTQYGTVYAQCERWDKILNGIDLVVECTAFKRQGEMSLYDMKEIAVLIDVEKRKIGIV